MKRMAWLVVAVDCAGRVRARQAAAADKAHQQLMAEIRMLQEQQQQLQQLLGGLARHAEGDDAKIDEQIGANRKAFADQKLLVDNVAEGVRVLREKADDTNVRLSSMTQELEAVRQAIASMPAPRRRGSVPRSIRPPGRLRLAPSTAIPPATPAAPPPTSRRRCSTTCLRRLHGRPVRSRHPRLQGPTSTVSRDPTRPTMRS